MKTFQAPIGFGTWFDQVRYANMVQNDSRFVFRSSFVPQGTSGVDTHVVLWYGHPIGYSTTKLDAIYLAAMFAAANRVYD